ncbi:hypothetical protein [Streptomyces thermolilacinus]|uniref:Uncharacterized protein n=1 Tax=Streptomyces thermolilacinus SPC6 TaxID=1306406 RepID=A0A1D3DQ21_9ACTN|nr:hypothetical protein [Streptomyces thermolilacinus]OEJ94414.1 hypothetical protein J116_007980 [Streptomyces thermolilacinus SPC6]
MAERDWELSRIREGWSLTNTSDRTARNVHVEFEGVMNGRPWREGVTPVGGLDAIGVIPPRRTVRLVIANPETAHKVSVRWRSRLRTKTWEKNV